MNTDAKRIVPSFWSWEGLLARPVVTTLLVTLVFLIALQFWRPHFFLTDDNLNHSPVLIESGRNLMEGKNPYVSHYLYEGNLLILRETSILHLSHPLLILTGGLFSLTPWPYLMVDCIASIYYLAAAGFTTLLYVRLREKYDISISNNLIIFLSLSSTFSIWSLAINSSAAMYILNQATLSLFLIGLINSDWRYGSLWVGLTAANAFLASHAGQLVFTIFFITLLVAVYCIIEKGYRPAIIWICGGLIALVLISPYVPYVLSGLMESRRISGLRTDEIVELNFLFPSSLVAFFTGFGCSFVGQTHYQNCALSPFISMALPCCFASWLLFRCKMPLRAVQPLAWCFLGFAAFSLLSTHRPLWFQEYFYQYIPLVRALRWPYKDIMFFIFFIHLWMVMVPPVGTARQLTVLALIGGLFWILPLAVGGAPSMSLREEDRVAITSGAADRYWAELKKKFPEDSIIVPAIGADVGLKGFWGLPQSALASYLYGSLFRVKTAFFYSPTRPVYERPGGGTFNVFGVLRYPPYLPEKVAEFPDWMKKDKRIRVLRALQVKPFKVELLNPSEETAEDVTPLWEKALRDSHAFAP